MCFRNQPETNSIYIYIIIKLLSEVYMRDHLTLTYRIPFGFSNILDRKTAHDESSQKKERTNGNVELVKQINKISPDLKQPVTQAIMMLIRSILVDSPLRFYDEELVLVASLLQHDIDSLDIKSIEISENYFKIKVAKETVGIHINFDQTDIIVKLVRETPQPTGAVQDILDKLDHIFLDMHSNRLVYKYVSTNGHADAYSNTGGAWDSEMRGYIGVDVGSMSTNVVFTDAQKNVIETVYTYTRGRVLDALKTGLKEIQGNLPKNVTVLGVGVTGSSGELAKMILNADVYKTEIYSHAAATIHQIPNVGTILEIGGQDSKVIYVKDGVPEKSKMNEWCGAGTGAMLDAQANRLGIPIKEFGEYALRAKKSVDFRTRCGVFMDSCMIDAQAKGYPIEVIVSGLCKACAHNFISTLGINRKSLVQPIAFQGGVANNVGVKKELEDYIVRGRKEDIKLIVPLFNNVMGALGMSLIVDKYLARRKKETSFRGFEEVYRIFSEVVECDAETCPKNLDKRNLCDVVVLRSEGKPIATIGACKEYDEIVLSSAQVVNLDTKKVCAVS